ncbi:hypothetical protein [Streptomyces sp. AC550_RSS872]|uniref:hypothetical protein n=1 Tax=Streptomyces sp. AC550_RSS872 TaxID=2823689 RepID=UPI001C256794|nr:hypothetical protein [Streptomyces sp. AC550_RSS872]
MHSIRRIFSVGAAALMLGAGLVVGSSGAAQAEPSDCTGGANGFTDIPDSLSGRGVAGAGAVIADFGGRPWAVASYGMHTGTVGGRQMGWGVLSTSSSTWGAGAIGVVWMDVTNDGKNSWIQCGPFTTTASGARITTPAYPTSNSASRAFRVCAQVTSASPQSGITCTPWW